MVDAYKKGVTCNLKNVYVNQFETTPPNSTRSPLSFLVTGLNRKCLIVDNICIYITYVYLFIVFIVLGNDSNIGKHEWYDAGNFVNRSVVTKL